MRAFRAPARGSFFICLRRPLFFQQRQGDIPRPGAGHVLLLSPTASFLSAAKEKRKRNAAKNYVFGFPYAASPAAYLALFRPRGRCTAQISPKYCTVSSSLFAAAFTLKCRCTSFYRGRNQRQRRRRGDSPFDRTTKLNSRDRVVQAAENHKA